MESLGSLLGLKDKAVNTETLKIFEKLTKRCLLG